MKCRDVNLRLKDAGPKLDSLMEMECSDIMNISINSDIGIKKRNYYFIFIFVKFKKKNIFWKIFHGNSLECLILNFIFKIRSLIIITRMQSIPSIYIQLLFLFGCMYIYLDYLCIYVYNSYLTVYNTRYTCICILYMNQASSIYQVIL